MANHRFFCPGSLASDILLTLPDEVARHAITVLRLKSGDAVTLFNGEGNEYSGILERQGKHTQVRLLKAHQVERESPLDITLVQGISSGERMDYTLQKSVELGVTCIQPVLMQRTIVRLDDEKRKKRRQHWQGVVLSACEQCGRNRLPEILPVQDFAYWFQINRSVPALKLMLDPAGEISVRDMTPPAQPLILVAGPEGGLDPREREILRSNEFIPLRLGPRILRTETAAVAALAVFQVLWGDF